MKVILSNQEVNIDNIKDRDAISINGKTRKLYPYTNDVKYFIFKKEKYFVIQNIDVSNRFLLGFEQTVSKTR